MQNAYENGAGWGLGSFAMTRQDRRRTSGREGGGDLGGSTWRRGQLICEAPDVSDTRAKHS